MRHSLLFIAIAAASTGVCAETSNLSPLVFDTTVVTATKTENSVADAPASIAVITSEDIKAQPSMALNEMVEQAVGVESRKEGGRAGRESISIRGMDSSYTLIMVNGRRLSSSNAIVRGNDFDLAAIPKESIERIEVIRGPMSALYGSEALGGVVNIITKQPDNDWSSDVSVDVVSPFDGNGGLKSLIGINTGGALVDDTFYMNLALNKNEREAWKPFAAPYQDATALEERDTLNLAGALSWYINDDHVLDFDVAHSDDHRISNRLHSKVVDPSDLQFTDGEVKRTNVSLAHTGTWGEVESKLRAYTDQVTVSEKDTAYGADTTSVKESTYNLDGSISTELGSHRLTIGGDARYGTLKNEKELTATGEASVHQQALFAQDEWALSDSMTLTLGGRMDHHEEFGFEFSPRAYLVANVTDRLILKGGVGTAFKAPSMLQLNDEYLLDSCKGTCKIIGNPNLKPETTISYELAVNYQADLLEAEAALFRNDVSNLIDRDFSNLLGKYTIPSSTTPNTGEVYTYKNINKALIQGIELGGRLILTNTLNLHGSYTFTDTEDKSTGLQLSDRPDQNISAQLNWQPTEQLTTFVRASYVGEQLVNGDLHEDGYTLVDLGLNYNLNENFQVRAGITNIGDTQLSEAANMVGYTEDPRTYYVGFTTTF